MNYKKYILLALLALIFILSGFYNQNNYKDILFYLNDPASLDLSEISIAGSILSISNGDAIIRESMYGKEILLKSVFENWKVGEFINIKGIFHKAGYIEYKKGELIWNKKIKFAFSVVGFIVFVYIFFLDRKKLRFSL